MIAIKEAIVVEGVYDKSKLSSIFHAKIITTEGFGIYKNKEMIQLIGKLADETGVILLTDSDSAGFRIRNYVRNHLKDKNVKNAFIPEIYGKEKRKVTPAKEGLLGVEGMEKEVLIEVFRRAGATFLEDEIIRKIPNKEPITKLFLYQLGLFGQENSREKRKVLLEKLDLPTHMSTNMMVEVLNVFTDKQNLQNLWARPTVDS